MTTSRRLGEVAVCASTERTRKLGIAVVPATAKAPFRRKKRRFICIKLTPSAALKLGRADQEPCKHLVFAFKIDCLRVQILRILRRDRLHLRRLLLKLLQHRGPR